MTTRFGSALLTIFVLVAACSNVAERTAWMGQVRPEDARQIGRLVRARTSATILSYDRTDDGLIAIDLRRRDGVKALWIARRVGENWKLYARDCMDSEL